jgi:hypothetical protein
MPEEQKRYEEEIEDILESSGDLPDPPKDSPDMHSALVDEVKGWIYEGAARRVGALTPLRLLIISLITVALFFISKINILAWIGLTSFLAAYVVFFIGRQGDKD